MGNWQTSDNFHVSGDSFNTLWFPVVSGVEMKIYGRSNILQALSFFLAPLTRIPFGMLLSCDF